MRKDKGSIDRHTDIQTYRLTDIQTYRHTDIQTYRQYLSTLYVFIRIYEHVQDKMSVCTHCIL